MKTIIKIYKGIEYPILLDEEDYEYYKNRSLIIHKGRQTLYVRFCFGHSGREYLHRKIMQCPDGMTVDHINGNGLDNRKSNLQICSMKENSRKQRKQKRPTKFVYKGITHRAGLKKPYRAKIVVDGKQLHIGYYSSLEEAAIAYNESAETHFGKFSILNEVK